MQDKQTTQQPESQENLLPEGVSQTGTETPIGFPISDRERQLEPTEESLIGLEAPSEPQALETRTQIPDGLEAPNAGAGALDRWLRQTLNVTLGDAQQRFPDARTIREIVYALENQVTPETSEEA